MPTFCEYRGIKFLMYYEEGKHHLPHFHLLGKGIDVVFSLSGVLLEGLLPGQLERIISQWAKEHNIELGENWQRARSKISLLPIAPPR